jgi:hypothetical protein
MKSSYLPVKPVTLAFQVARFRRKPASKVSLVSGFRSGLEIDM